jgi:hypothetical protein
MGAALRAEDPGALPVPYMLSGGTDAKAFSTLGIRCFGFTPLRLPPELNFSALFHGIDERVPIDGLRFGARVLDRLFGDTREPNIGPSGDAREPNVGLSGDAREPNIGPSASA